MRTVLGVSVRVVIFWLTARAFLVAPIVVQTSSMAPTLRGLHGHVVCPKCNRELVWGADLAEFAAAELVCFHCGATQNAVADRALMGGDGLLVDRNAFLVRSPRRWDLAVLADPEAPDRWLVKRIVGLPGETISIRDGDLFAGEARIKKSLAQLQSLAAPIYHLMDDAHPCQAAQWCGEGEATGWARRVSGQDVKYEWSPRQPALQDGRKVPFDWLRFRSLKDKRPVSDALPYNQDRLRQPFPVSDVLLSFKARCQGDGALAIRLPAAKDVRLQFDPRAGVCEILVDGNSLRKVNCPRQVNGAAFRLAFAFCDGRLLADVSGSAVAVDVEDHILRASADRVGVPAVGARGLEVEISELRLARDIYYAPPADPLIAPWNRVQLVHDEFLLLGDNPQFSRDSRDWRPAAVSGNSLLGRPFLLHQACRPWRLGGQVFQVPDFERIRYIPTVADE